jgi:hypothetical protein
MTSTPRTDDNKHLQIPYRPQVILGKVKLQIDTADCTAFRQNSTKVLQKTCGFKTTDISQYRLLFGFSLLYTDRVPFELLDSAALL